jgi:hypothetical protein
MPALRRTPLRSFRGRSFRIIFSLDQHAQVL